MAHFQHWLDAHSTTAARTQANEANLDNFLESLLVLEHGGRCLAEDDDNEPVYAGAPLFPTVPFTQCQQQNPACLLTAAFARTEEWQRGLLDEAVSEASGSDADDSTSDGNETGSGPAQQASDLDDFIECSSGSERSFRAGGSHKAKRARTVGESAAASAGPEDLAGGAKAGSQTRLRGSTLHAYFEPLPLGPPQRSFALPSTAVLPQHLCWYTA